MTTITRRARALLLGGTALAVAACGAGDDATPSIASNAIDVTATEFEFEPAGWAVSEGTEFEIDFRNEGKLEHEWAVIKLGENIAAEADFAEDKVLLEVEAIKGGTSTTQSFTIDEAGTYQVICAIETHFDAGMDGILTVE